MIVAFTGHRPNSLYGYDKRHSGNQLIISWLRHHIKRIALKYSEVTFITGGALGVDQWAADIVHQVRDENPDRTIISEIFIPCKEQEKTWPEPSKVNYYKLLEQADSVIYTSRDPYKPHLMEKRNRAMVDAAEGLIAVWNQQPKGGTYNCVMYAGQKEVPIIAYDPVNHQQFVPKFTPNHSIGK